MPAPLPQPLTEYFRASNEHDVAALLASFAVEATVEDEGKKYLGAVAIRKWIEETIRKYDVTVEGTGTRNEDAKTVVMGLIAGKCRGSHVNVTYECTLDGE